MAHLRLSSPSPRTYKYVIHPPHGYITARRVTQQFFVYAISMRDSPICNRNNSPANRWFCLMFSREITIAYYCECCRLTIISSRGRPVPHDCCVETGVGGLRQSKRRMQSRALEVLSQNARNVAHASTTCNTPHQLNIY